MKYHRDETNKKEAQLQEQISKNDSELYREREMYKKLSNSFNAMKKQYDELCKEKDRNDYEIKSLKDREKQLEDKLRQVHEELERSEGTEIRNQLKEHVDNRKKHLDEIRDVLSHLNDHITRLNLNEEFVPNESAWH